MPIQLFGYVLRTNEEEQRLIRSPVAPQKEDSAIEIGGAMGGVNQRILVNDNTFKSENDLILKYRDAAVNPEVDMAIEEIVSETIVVDDVKNTVVSLKFNEGTKIPPNLQRTMEAEFQNILEMLDFTNTGHDIFRRWYVDGRIYFHKVIDETRPQDGILQIRYIDPRKIKRVREFVPDPNYPRDQFSAMNSKFKEYWAFNDNGIDSGGQSFLTQIPNGLNVLPIAIDSIAWATSGLFDPTGRMVVSRLHKILRTLNQYRMLEDAVVIYHLTHATTRRKFKIAVGNLPKPKAEQAVRDAMAKFKNRLTYNSSTGEINEDRRFMALTEDFWFPVRDAENNTDVEQFEGGAHMGEIDQVALFRTKLYKGLNVPVDRMDSENSPIIAFGGGTSQISREELKFARFIEMLRARFSMLFEDLLCSQLVLKGYATKDEFESIKREIIYDFARDTYYSEAKEIEIANSKVMAAMQAMQLLGQSMMTPLLSREWIYKNILRFTDEEIEQVEAQIEEDMLSGAEMQAQTNAIIGPPPDEEGADGQQQQQGQEDPRSLNVPQMESEVLVESTQLPEALTDYLRSLTQKKAN